MKNPISYHYPSFEPWNPIGFYYHQLSELQEERTKRLPNFSVFVFVTSWLHLTRASPVKTVPSDEQLLTDVAEHEEEWRCLFVSVGIHFSVITPEESKQLFPGFVRASRIGAP